MASPINSANLGSLGESNVSQRDRPKSNRSKLSPSGRFYTRGNVHHTYSFAQSKRKFRVKIDVMNKQTKLGYKLCLNVPIPVVQKQDITFRSLYKFIGWRRHQKFLPKRLIRFKKFLPRIVIVNRCLKFCRGKNLINSVPKYLAIEYVRQVSKKESFESSKILFDKCKLKIFHPELKYICGKVFGALNRTSVSGINSVRPETQISRPNTATISAVAPCSQVTVCPSGNVLDCSVTESVLFSPDASSILPSPIILPSNGPSVSDSLADIDVIVNDSLLIIPAGDNIKPNSFVDSIVSDSLPQLDCENDLPGAINDTLASTSEPLTNSDLPAVASSLRSEIQPEETFPVTETRAIVSVTPKVKVTPTDSVLSKLNSKAKIKSAFNKRCGKIVKAAEPHLSAPRPQAAASNSDLLKCSTLNENHHLIKDFKRFFDIVDEFQTGDPRDLVAVTSSFKGVAVDQLMSWLLIPLQNSIIIGHKLEPYHCPYSEEDVDEIKWRFDSASEESTKITTYHQYMAGTLLTIIYDLSSSDEPPFIRDFDQIYHAIVDLTAYAEEDLLCLLHIDGCRIDDFISFLRTPFLTLASNKAKSILYRYCYTNDTLDALELYLRDILIKGCPIQRPRHNEMANACIAYMKSVSLPTGPSLTEISFDFWTYSHKLTDNLCHLAIGHGGKVTIPKAKQLKSKPNEPTYISGKRRRSKRTK